MRPLTTATPITLPKNARERGNIISQAVRMLSSIYPGIRQTRPIRKREVSFRAPNGAGSVLPEFGQWLAGSRRERRPPPR